MLLSSTFKLPRLVFSAFVLATSASAQGLNVGLKVEHISVVLTVSTVVGPKGRANEHTCSQSQLRRTSHR